MRTKPFLHILFIIFFFLLGKQEMLSQEFKVIGYLPTYRFYLMDSVDYEGLTHLNIAFAGPDDEGFLSANGIDISPVVERAHASDVEVYISLAGGVAPIEVWNFWLSEDYRSFFIHNIIDFLQQYNLQGVDVDLEWGNVNDDYSEFVLELRDSIDVYSYGLSAALPGTYRYPEVSDEALNTYDWINLMAYDLRGPWNPNNPGQHSPYSFAVDAISYWKGQGLTKEKMNLGVPFYGYDFSDPLDVHSVKYSEMVDLDTAYAWIDQVGQIYYNGLNTIHQKTNLAFEECSGIMIWELGQDNFKQYSLLQEIINTVNDLSTDENIYDSPYLDEVNLYPNPAQNFIKLESFESSIEKVELYSPDGQKHAVYSFLKNEHCTIPVNQLESGIYFLHIWTKQNHWLKKFVKQ